MKPFVVLSNSAYHNYRLEETRRLRDCVIAQLIANSLLTLDEDNKQKLQILLVYWPLVNWSTARRQWAYDKLLS